MNTMTRARAPIRRILTRFPIEALMCAATFRADSAASKLLATSPKLLATEPSPASLSLSKRRYTLLVCLVSMVFVLLSVLLCCEVACGLGRLRRALHRAARDLHFPLCLHAFLSE
jgi:hypothetical protein